MISELTKQKWIQKINSITEAYKRNLIYLSEDNINFLDTIRSLCYNNIEISIRQSKYLNRLYEKLQ